MPPTASRVFTRQRPPSRSWAPVRFLSAGPSSPPTGRVAPGLVQPQALDAAGPLGGSTWTRRRVTWAGWWPCSSPASRASTLQETQTPCPQQPLLHPHVGASSSITLIGRHVGLGPTWGAAPAVGGPTLIGAKYPLPQVESFTISLVFTPGTMSTLLDLPSPSPQAPHTRCPHPLSRPRHRLSAGEPLSPTKSLQLVNRPLLPAIWPGLALPCLGTPSHWWA